MLGGECGGCGGCGDDCGGDCGSGGGDILTLTSLYLPHTLNSVSQPHITSHSLNLI